MKDIKRRVKSVESTMQITKAMELVASSKLRKARNKVDMVRPFFQTSYEAIVDLCARSQERQSVFTKKRKVRSVGYIVIAGDRGLAGGYNANVLKYATSEMKDKNAKVVPIGKKAIEHFNKQNVKIIQEFSVVEDSLHLSECFELAEVLTKMYLEKEIDELYIIYTNFVSMLSQQPASIQLLPLNFEGAETVSKRQVIYEPSVEGALASIIPQYIGGLLYGALIESYASEQGARRTAMEAASDNAQDMIDHLNLQYNRSRQTAITQEITEIASAAEALK